MPTLFEYYNTGDNSAANFYGTRWRGQIFTPAVQHKITSVKLKFYRAGSPGTITVGIRAISGGSPVGGDLCSGTTDGDTLPTGSPYEWREITLGDGYNLYSDVQYAIVARVPSGDASNDVWWRRPAVTGEYPGGYLIGSTDGGLSWTTTPTLDFMFEDWGDPAVLISLVTTHEVSNIGTETATGGGNITHTGGENCSKRGVCWNTAGNPTVADNKSEETDSFGKGSFSLPITGLVAGTLYYVRAYAYNSAGYGYGVQVSFIAGYVRGIGAFPLQSAWAAGRNYIFYKKHLWAEANQDRKAIWQEWYFGEIAVAAGGWTNISKVNGIASALISKINGIAVASISKVNGVAV